MVNTLEITVDASSTIISVSGLCPYMAWLDATLNVPNAEPGEVVIYNDTPFTKGIPVRLTPPKTIVPVFVDYENGWVKVAVSHEPVIAVEVAPRIIIAIEARERTTY
ncbi:MAG: hypothetical protein ABSB70_12345 [Candidatus Velthaea sp.]